MSFSFSTIDVFLIIGTKSKSSMITRMHSSGMSTTHLLTVSQHALHRGGRYPSMHWVGGRGVYLSMHWAGGCLPKGVYLSGGACTCPGERCTCPVGWCNCPGDVPAHGGVSQHAMGQTPLWTDRHLWKHNLHKLHLRAVTRNVLYLTIDTFSSVLVKNNF